MRTTAASIFSVTSILVSSVSTIQVTPGSSCASTCLDSSSDDLYSSTSLTTNATDIVCNDTDYFSSSVGVKFKDCLECLQTSNEVDGSESDSSWFIYNLRFASAVCLYDYPKHRENSTSSCNLSSACLPLQTALETDLDLSKSPSEFGYCSADNSAFYGTSIDDCISCLQSSSDTYGANFLLALQVGCEQQPENGTLLSISGNIFSEYPINSTSSSSTNTSTSASASTSNNSAVLSQGSVAGIACGAAGLLLVAAMLFGIHWRRQKKWEKEDNITFVDPHDFYGKGFSNGGGGSDVPTLASANSHQPRFTYDHKTAAIPPQPTYQTHGSNSDQEFEMDFTNNADYYNRMESRSRGRQARPVQPQLSEEFNSAAHVDASALPAHPAYIPRDRLTPSRVGSRSSHRSTPSARSSAHHSPPYQQQQQSHLQHQQPQSQTQPRYNKPDPYTIQVYLNSVDDAKIPSSIPTNPLSQHPTDGILRNVGINRETSLRDIKIELAGPPEMSADYEYTTSAVATPDNRNYYNSINNSGVGSNSSPANFRQGGRTTPIPQGGRTTPMPQNGRSTPASGRGTPAPGGVRDSGASLILPTMPRMRGSNKRSPPKLSIGIEPSPPASYQRGGSVDITGPLAFPDSRFGRQRSGGDDRIVEQTVDRVAHPRMVEVPIGSGKSYLYG